MLTELGRAVPEIKGPLIDERDQYLVSRRWSTPARGKRKVVAVVGAAHVPGMQAQLRHADRSRGARPDPAAVAALERDQVAHPDPVPRGAIVWGWQRSDTTSFAEMMLAWILPTSIGAGALTLLAGGSILSVLSALVVAPIAAIHPLLGTGMVVGVVEAWRRKPSVADCERLPEDIQSLRGFWRNPVTRILLIAVASGIGTAVGFWVGVGWVASCCDVTST